MNKYDEKYQVDAGYKPTKLSWKARIGIPLIALAGALTVHAFYYNPGEAVKNANRINRDTAEKLMILKNNAQKQLVLENIADVNCNDVNDIFVGDLK